MSLDGEMPGKHKVKLIMQNCCFPFLLSSSPSGIFEGRNFLPEMLQRWKNHFESVLCSTWAVNRQQQEAKGCILTAELLSCSDLARASESAITARGLNDLGGDSRYCKHAEPLRSQDAPLSRLSSCICLHHRQTVGGGRLFLRSAFLFGAMFAAGWKTKK